jgi:3-hydroxybutyryl-CoA dehydratase
MKVKPGEKFSEIIQLTPEDASAFALAARDHNPIHHDPEAAARSRFQRLTASGTQTTSRLIALTATHFSKLGDMVGLEFSVKFHRPVYADDTILLEWEVLSVEHSLFLGGEVVDLRGRVSNSAKEKVISATGRVLVMDKT